MKLKPFFLLLQGVLIGFLNVHAQSTMTHSFYKAVTINMDVNTAYSKTLILLHEIYDGTNTLPTNYAVGTIMAVRGTTGADHRLNVVNIHSGSGYRSIRAFITSNNDMATDWKLKTCTYNGKRYMALDVPYKNQQHKEGYHFAGWVRSSGENLKTVTYEINGVPQNQNVLSNVQDFSPNMIARHQVSQLTITGNVGIGTSSPAERLSVNGNIRAKEVKVEMANWPDYVFKEGYVLPSLVEVDKYIQSHGHLPGIPTTQEAEANGIELGEINRKLLEKVEELTLHLIEKDRENTLLQDRLSVIEKHIGITKTSYEK
ncbi:hypothetical protein [Parapedobacter koreensis]|uniref:Uncharacterized protein n=1 Tax=Parapedobacter koreensis TaxID=332977 RepID=A0A1H7UGA1_9SPHI|nr:hypothetical protein [Parapedobacter koreensis]SEL95774.1 hypothetical protein SAMN05421740_11543 [Parapedobacter koreensis]